MTLEEMDDKWREEQLRLAFNREQAKRWLGEHNTGEAKPVVNRSLYCQNNSHAACRWAECKCVCHDSADWCGHC